MTLHKLSQRQVFDVIKVVESHFITVQLCRILRWLTDEDEQLKFAGLPHIEFLIVEMSRELHFFSHFRIKCNETNFVVHCSCYWHRHEWHPRLARPVQQSPEEISSGNEWSECSTTHLTIKLTLRITFLLSPQLVLANPGPVVMDKLHASKLTDLIGDDKIFLTVADAIQNCSPKYTDEVWKICIVDATRVIIQSRSNASWDEIIV